jgi:hypothetical protein
VFYGRDYLNIALKDQLLRKISSKRTVKIKTLERELRAPPKDYDLRYSRQMSI